MHKNLLRTSNSFALYEITEEVPLDEAGIYETSYPYEEIIYVERLRGYKVRVTYTCLEPMPHTEQ